MKTNEEYLKELYAKRYEEQVNDTTIVVEVKNKQNRLKRFVKNAKEFVVDNKEFIVPVIGGILLTTIGVKIASDIVSDARNDMEEALDWIADNPDIIKQMFKKEGIEVEDYNDDEIEALQMAAWMEYRDSE